jgi:uncharacterized protein (TIGR02145 family)
MNKILGEEVNCLLPLFLFIVFSLTGYSQLVDTFIDPRDGQGYRYRSINGVSWMLDNLNFESEMSIQVDREFNNAPKGRFYHIYELDSVCPDGWTVSRKEDWLSYFGFLINNASDSTLKVQENKMDEIVEIDHWGKLDVFNEVNPLEIDFTSWMEGGKWMTNDLLPRSDANFWVLEPERDELERTHVHIDENRIRIHRHKHNLKPNQEKKLRQFMVRCVKL